MISHKDETLSAAKESTLKKQGGGDNKEEEEKVDEGQKGSNPNLKKNDCSMSRSERKCYQEKRRRKEFNEAMGNLQSILLKYDEAFLTESEQREGLLSRRLTNKRANSTTENDNGMFNRIELINQACFTLKALAEENVEYEELIEDFKTGKPILRALPFQNKDKKTTFHRGVGPLPIDSQMKALPHASFDELSNKHHHPRRELHMVSTTQQPQQQRQHLLENFLPLDAQTITALSKSNSECIVKEQFPLIATMEQYQQRQKLQLTQQMYLDQHRQEVLNSQFVTNFPSVDTSLIGRRGFAQLDQATVRDDQIQSPQEMEMLMNYIRKRKFDSITRENFDN